MIFLFIGILISAGLELIGVGSIPVFISFLLKPDHCPLTFESETKCCALTSKKG